MWRRAVQVAFFLINLWIGVQFWLWVRFYESGGRTMAVSRPAGVEGWLPIAALMNLKVLVFTGEVPAMHAAGMFLLIAFLTASVLMKKAFCSWLCPVGSFSEVLWKFGRGVLGGRNIVLPRWLDIPLRSLKYILMGLFLYAVSTMAVDDIGAFLGGPYGMVADVKMLNFFRYLSTGGALTVGFLAIASVFVQNAWCRFLCPYGALMGIASLVSPARIRRSESACIDCGKCARACPAVLPVDKLVQIRSAECMNCLECVAVCPAEGALALRVTPARRAVPAWAVAALVLGLFVGLSGYAKYMGFWDTHLPERVYFELVAHASEFSHP